MQDGMADMDREVSLAPGRLERLELRGSHGVEISPSRRCFMKHLEG
jgi:hypothetical protein